MVASTGLSHKVVSPPHNDSQQDCPIRIRERSIAVSLQNHAFTALSAAGFALLRHQGGARSMFEHLTDTLVRLCGTLQVFVGTDLLADLLTLFRGHWLLAGLVKLLDGLLVVSQIFLAAYKDDGKPAAEM